MTKTERFKKILIDCLTKEKIPTVEEWSFSLNTSRPTITNTVKEVKIWLAEKGLILEGKPGKGYTLKGTEEKIRDAIVTLLLQENIKKEEKHNLLKKILNNKTKRINPSSFYLSHLIEGINLIKIRKIADNIQRELKTKLTDIDYLKFILTLSVTVKRIREKHFLFLEPRRLFNVMQTPEYNIIHREVMPLERPYEIKFSPEEIGYITIHFIISRVRMLSYSISENKEGEDLHLKYAKEIARITEEVFDLPVTRDMKFIQMLALHLKSALKKLQYGIKIENPLLNEIKTEYPLPFSIAERIALMLGEKDLPIPKEEVGYIAMYIAMAIEKIRYKKRQRKKVAVVCTMALGTSGLLFWRLLNELPEVNVVQVGSYEDIVNKKIDKDVELIISTVPLPDPGIPHIIVSPFLTPHEQSLIRRKLGLTKRGKETFQGLYQELDAALLFPQLEADSAEEVIKILGDALYKNKYVREEYLKATIMREEKFPTGLSTEIPIAIPHAEAIYTKKVGIAMATLKKPVIFYDMGNPKKALKIRIVIMPALSINAEDNALFYELLKSLKGTALARKLIHCTTPKGMKEVLVKHIHIN